MSEKRGFFGTQTSKWLLAGAAILVIGVGVGVADWARGGRDQGFGPGWRGGPDRQARMQRMCERDPLRFEGVVRAFLKADLDLKPDQNGKLDELAGVLVPALKDVRDEVCNNFSAQGPVTAPVKLERLAATLRKAADAAEKAVPPAKTFYATLDDKQKARVDELSERRRGPMGRGMMHTPGMHGPGGHQGGPGYWR
jgi:hypothetical protein